MENWVKRFREIPMVKLLRESECVAHNDEDEDLANIMTEVNKHEWDKIEDFISQELDKAREEGRESIIAELSISENMEKVEGFFREAPMDYDDKCNLWNDFLSKLKQ